MNLNPTDNYSQASQRILDLIEVLKFQRKHYPDELTWFQRSLIHQEISANLEVIDNLEIDIEITPRYKLHKSLNKKVEKLIKTMQNRLQ